MQHVDVRVHDSVATIKIDRQAACNALSPSVIEDLRTAISDVHQEKRVGAVVLTAAGDHFCSGLDMKVLAQIDQLPNQDGIGEWFSTWSQLSELLQDVLRLPKPIVAAIDGAAMGAGFGIALAADMIVMSDRATLAANAVRHGLVGGATAALLSFRCGGSVAARMVLGGETIDAKEAYRLGLSIRTVTADQIWVTASAIAQACAAAPREALQANKRLLNERIGEQLMSQMVAATADSATACTTDSATEGIRAFVERRTPDWQ